MWIINQPVLSFYLKLFLRTLKLVLLYQLTVKLLVVVYYCYYYFWGRMGSRVPGNESLWETFEGAPKPITGATEATASMVKQHFMLSFSYLKKCWSLTYLSSAKDSTPRSSKAIMLVCYQTVDMTILSRDLLKCGSYLEIILSMTLLFYPWMLS